MASHNLSINISLMTSQVVCVMSWYSVMMQWCHSRVMMSWSCHMLPCVDKSPSQPLSSFMEYEELAIWNQNKTGINKYCHIFLYLSVIICLRKIRVKDLMPWPKESFIQLANLTMTSMPSLAQSISWYLDICFSKT